VGLARRWSSQAYWQTHETNKWNSNENRVGAICLVLLFALIAIH
jgi:hypothetical protein